MRLFEPAPEDFDPIAASAHELLAYGYPERPNEDLDPARFAQWTRRMSRPSSMITPEFAPIPEAILPRSRGTSINWCGAVSFAAPGDSVNAVSGDWTVPHVMEAGGPGAYICATWIGIDGWGQPPPADLSIARHAAPGGIEAPPPIGNLPPREPSTDVLQAGTTQMVIVFEDYGWLSPRPVRLNFLWWEWAPCRPYTIMNFEVSPGDVIFCEIFAHSPTEAHIHVLNDTTGVMTAFTTTAPPGTRLIGDCAEWILELPIGDVTIVGQAYPLELARFGHVYFDDCDAATVKGVFPHLHGGDGLIVTMIDAAGSVVCNAVAESDMLIKVN